MPETPKAPSLPSFTNQDELDQLLLEGLNSGAPIEATDDFWTDLRRQARENSNLRVVELKKAS